MRVITGAARGKPLETLPGEEVVRPTAERVKEGMFSAVQFRVAGAKVLDLFAGSGQLGVEALSRGASLCVFVDASRQSTDVVLRNLRRTGLQQNARVLTGDSFRYLDHCKETFDLVLVDPPYRKDLCPRALEQLEGAVAPGGYVLCETEKEAEMPETLGGLALKKQYKYGKTRVWMYVRPETGEEMP